MSYNLESDHDMLGKAIQELVNYNDYEEIMISKDDNKWNITADGKRFWSALMTPSEIKNIKAENELLKNAFRSVMLSLVNVDSHVHSCGEARDQELINWAFDMAKDEFKRYGDNDLIELYKKLEGE